MDYKKLHEHILQEHDLFLIDDELKEIVRVVLKITDNKPDIIKDQKGGQHLFPVFDDYPLFEHMDKEYGIALLEGQLSEIIRIVLEMHNEKPDTSAESIERQYKEKGNQLGEVYGAIKDAPVRTIASYIRVSRQMLDDKGLPTSYINQRLNKLFLEEDDQILYGNGMQVTLNNTDQEAE